MKRLLSEQEPNRLYPKTDRSASAPMPTILERIVETKRREVELLRPRREELRELALAAPPARSLTSALRSPGRVRLLAEIKRRSPSAGPIRADAEPAAIARAYETGGAAAISVLTDRDYFGGSLDDLRVVRSTVAVPVLRKDFVIDPVQLWEARAAGADAALLIVRILDADGLRDLLAGADDLGMDVLVEAHSEDELRRALAAGAKLVGINHRNLATFEVDLGLAERVAPDLPGGTVLVAESGIRSAADVDRLGEAGVDAVLVGESLMRQEHPGHAAAALADRPKRDRGMP